MTDKEKLLAGIRELCDLISTLDDALKSFADRFRENQDEDIGRGPGFVVRGVASDMTIVKHRDFHREYSLISVGHGEKIPNV